MCTWQQVWHGPERRMSYFGDPVHCTSSQVRQTGQQFVCLRYSPDNASNPERHLLIHVHSNCCFVPCVHLAAPQCNWQYAGRASINLFTIAQRRCTQLPARPGHRVLTQAVQVVTSTLLTSPPLGHNELPRVRGSPSCRTASHGRRDGLLGQLTPILRATRLC
jgi:hypothetical protein